MKRDSHSEQLSDAVTALEEAARLSPDSNSTPLYNPACVEERFGNRDQAFAWLRKAEDSGLEMSRIDSDEDLQSLRDDPGFDQILSRAIERSETRWKCKLKTKGCRGKRAGNARAHGDRVHFLIDSRSFADRGAAGHSFPGRFP